MGEWFAENKTTLIGLVVVVVAVYIFICIKDAIGRKKGVDSEEKRRVQDIARRLVSDCASYTVGYATHHRIESAIGKTTTYYYYYAVAFKPGVLQVIPLSISGGEITAKESVCLLPELLGRVKLSNKGATMALFDKEDKAILEFTMGPSYTRFGKFDPVNIQQAEEAEKFKAFSSDFAARVNG